MTREQAKGGDQVRVRTLASSFDGLHSPSGSNPNGPPCCNPSGANGVRQSDAVQHAAGLRGRSPRWLGASDSLRPYGYHQPTGASGAQ
ncbi:MAG: hypothetical protein OXG81_09310 [Acidobacteria bacterium]|nr:hypothetical protein [Acidobacteriota bacterium]